MIAAGKTTIVAPSWLAILLLVVEVLVIVVFMVGLVALVRALIRRP